MRWQTPSSAADGANPTSATSSSRDCTCAISTSLFSTRSWNSTCGCACWKAASAGATPAAVSSSDCASTSKPTRAAV
ncbi:hypothetical protein G6F55_014345 [Rhizopus delemar]|nr:hypothetical protein G6F55_014345 [Rhizopus delemar]